MAARAADVALIAGALVAGCAGPIAMGGFSEHDARVTSVAPSRVNACSVQTGLLIIEIERVVVNEYPHHDPTSAHGQQPLLVRSVFSEGQPEMEGEVQAWVSPLRYRPGQSVGSFAALRVLERPLRALAAKRIVLRLAENDRTNPAGWNHVAQAAAGAAGASGAVGVPVVPSALVQEGVHLLAKLDHDDLILLWQIEAGSLVGALASAAVPGGPSGVPALRFALGTTRRAPDGKAPAAVAEVLVYRQPEPGCP